MEPEVAPANGENQQKIRVRIRQLFSAELAALNKMIEEQEKKVQQCPNVTINAHGSRVLISAFKNYRDVCVFCCIFSLSQQRCFSLAQLLGCLQNLAQQGRSKLLSNISLDVWP
jgi:hypothetical protein